MDRKTKRIVNNVSLGLVVILGIILVLISLKIYINKIDREAAALLEKADAIYISSNNDTNNEELFVSNVKENLIDYLKKKYVDKIIYKIDNEDFYLVFQIVKNENEETENSYSFNLDKIVNEKLGVNAVVNILNVCSIEYRSLENNYSTILKINTDYEKKYLAMTEETHYFLGNDIEYISYMDNHFYYLSYNPKYRALLEANECSQEIKNSIQYFNQNDYFYRYGKVNFLKEFYQKLPSKSFSVQEKCNELASKETSE